MLGNFPKLAQEAGTYIVTAVGFVRDGNYEGAREQVALVVLVVENMSRLISVPARQPEEPLPTSRYTTLPAEAP